jgi:type IV/VI secretion system ImpK/VasF family protein
VQPEPVAEEPAAIGEASVEGQEERDELAAAEAAFSAFDEPPPASDDAFASVDDALPAEPLTAEELYNRRFAPQDSPEQTTRPAEVQSEVPSYLEPPPPPAGFDQPFTTFEMDAPLVPAGTVDDSRSTLEVDAAAAPPALDDEDTDTGEMVPPTPPEVTAAQELERPPFFVPKFRSFYNEIVSHKHQKAEFTAGFATAVMDYTADLSPDAAAQALSKRLQDILELQAAEATWMGGEAAARYPDAQYAMAALADEVFSHLDWPGKEAWPRYLIEQRLFKSNAKDVEFFKRVDRLLKNEQHNPTPAARDLARMYLLVLAAGFQGKYRPFGLNRALAEYRRRLYEFVYGDDPLMIYDEQRKLFPEAAERVVVGRAVSRFSMLQQWAAVLVMLIGYAVISQMAWNRVSADLKDVTARVEAANSSATSDGVAGEPR